ncbi:MAG TPA: serine hydrolase [Candidatus Baltobacteraceae bacterium]|jgi:beta-lactamase class A|nr:serine hydrolase [Candidatus Baltobacteraceae bacterium]
MNRRFFLAGGIALSVLPLGARAAGIAERVDAIARDSSGVVGVFCRTLAEGPPLIAYNANEQFPTASTIKLLILTTAFHLEERRPGTLDRFIVAHRSALIGGSPFMERLRDGARVTVRELLVPMITLSDNTASNALMRHFGLDEINAVGVSAGMNHTKLARRFLDYTAIVHHHDNVTTPRDMGTLLHAIARGAREGVRTIVSPEHCRRMIDIMLGQTDRDAIPAGLPPNTQVANKTGEIDGTRNDVAIVEPFRDSPYILVIYSKWLRDYGAMYDVMHRVAQLSYSAVGTSNA